MAPDKWGQVRTGPDPNDHRAFKATRHCHNPKIRRPVEERSDGSGPREKRLEARASKSAKPGARAQALSHPFSMVTTMSTFPPESTIGSDGSPDSLVVDCDTCVMANSDVCGDCLVTFICDRRPDEAVIISLDEMRAMRALSAGGLVPGLKHQARG